MVSFPIDQRTQCSRKHLPSKAEVVLTYIPNYIYRIPLPVPRRRQPCLSSGMGWHWLALGELKRLAQTPPTLVCLHKLINTANRTLGPALDKYS